MLLSKYNTQSCQHNNLYFVSRIYSKSIQMIKEISLINKTLNLDEISEEHTKGCVLSKTHSNKHPNYARKCLDDL